MRLASLLSVCVLLGACGNTARITLDDGNVVEGKIVGGSVASLIVEDERSGDTDSIPRASIADVDHPGNVALTAGLIWTLVGVASIALGAPRCESKGVPSCIGVFLPAAFGLGLAGYGNSVYFRSLRESGMRKSSAFSLRVLPIIQPQASGAFAGLAAATLF